MKKNGFTLVELLAVIVILAVIGFIGFGSVTKINHDVKKATFEKTLTQIVDSAETYANDNKEELEEQSNEMLLNGATRKYEVVTLAELIQQNYIETTDVIKVAELPSGSKAVEFCVHPNEDEIPNGANKNDYCYSINHYEDGKSLNNMELVIYFSNNKTKKVKSCVYKNENNKLLLNDPSYKEFLDLNTYCSVEKVGNVLTPPSLNLSITSDETGLIPAENTWINKKKYVQVEIVANTSELVNYKVCINSNCQTMNFPDGTSDVYTFAQEVTYESLGNTTSGNVTVIVNPDTDNITKTIAIRNIDSGNAPTCKVMENGAEKTGWYQSGGSAPSYSCSQSDYKKKRKYTIECIDDGECKVSSYTHSFSKDGDALISDSYVLEDKAGNSTTCYFKVCTDGKPPVSTGFKNYTNAENMINRMGTVGNALSNAIGSLLDSLSWDDYRNYSCKDVHSSFATCTYKLRILAINLNISSFNASYVNANDIFNVSDEHSGIDRVDVAKEFDNKIHKDEGDFMCNTDVDPCRWTYTFTAYDKAGNATQVGKMKIIIDVYQRYFLSKIDFDEPGVWDDV